MRIFLIQRVHKWIDEETVTQRMNHINNFEKLLEESGTKVLKFYLHVSKVVQLERLEERKTNIEKMWKHKDQDMIERESWDEYMKAYEDCFANCDKSAEWQIIPADKNWYKEYLIAKSICTTLEKMDPQWPVLESSVK
jgi:polyphosphate kinase 2 (PPK2 family)